MTSPDKPTIGPDPRTPTPVCPCQYGICGACDGANNAYGQARHDRCATRQHLKHYGHPPALHDSVRNHKGFAVAALITGCRYVCPCTCRTDPALAAPPPRRTPASLPAQSVPRPEPEAQASLLDSLEAAA